MHIYERRRMEMLERVDQYGKKPELTLTAIITALLAVVNTNLVAMRTWLAGQVNGQGGYREGAVERRGLRNEIFATLRDMRGIVEALYARVREAVDRHRAALEALADALLERETLEGAEAIAILHAHGVTTDDPLRRRLADDLLRGSRRTGSLRGERRGLDVG
jgi:hypothetical protein